MSGMGGMRSTGVWQVNEILRNGMVGNWMADGGGHAYAKGVGCRYGNERAVAMPNGAAGRATVATSARLGPYAHAR